MSLSSSYWQGIVYVIGKIKTMLRTNVNEFENLPH